MHVITHANMRNADEYVSKMFLVSDFIHTGVHQLFILNSHIFLLSVICWIITFIFYDTTFDINLALYSVQHHVIYEGHFFKYQ